MGKNKFLISSAIFIILYVLLLLFLNFGGFVIFLWPGMLAFFLCPYLVAYFKEEDFRIGNIGRLEIVCVVLEAKKLKCKFQLGRKVKPLESLQRDLPNAEIEWTNLRETEIHGAAISTF